MTTARHARPEEGSMQRIRRKASSRHWTRSGARRHAKKQKLLEHFTFKFPHLAFQLGTRSRLDRPPQPLCLPLLPAVDARLAQFLDSPEFPRLGSWSQRLRLLTALLDHAQAAQSTEQFSLRTE